MARLPIVGQDGDTWGSIIAEYLEIEHNPDGTHKNPVLSMLTDEMEAGTGVVSKVISPSLLVSAINLHGPATPGQKGFVQHGANGAEARPAGYASVEWVGSVEPVNMIDGDTWIVTN